MVEGELPGEELLKIGGSGLALFLVLALGAGVFVEVALSLDVGALEGIGPSAELSRAAFGQANGIPPHREIFKALVRSHGSGDLRCA